MANSKGKTMNEALEVEVEETPESILRASLEAIEESNAAAQIRIDRGNALTALIEDPNFKLVITDNYLEGEMNRLAGVITDPEEFSKEIRDQFHGMLDSIRDLKQYFRMTMLEGNEAMGVLTDNEAYRQQLQSDFNGE